MLNDSHAPATKGDLQYLMGNVSEQMDSIYGAIDFLYKANERWKEEIIHEFHIVAEDIRHDCLGANKDEIENLKIRVTRLEAKC